MKLFKYKWIFLREAALVALTAALLIGMCMLLSNIGGLGLRKYALLTGVLLVEGRFFFASPRLYLAFLAVGALGAMSILLPHTLSGANTSFNSVGYSLFWLLGLSCLLAVICNLGGKWWRRCSSFILLGVYIAFCWLFFAYYLAEGVCLDGGAVLAVMQTNVSESIEYVMTRINLGIVFSLLAGLAALLALAGLTGHWGGLRSAKNLMKVLVVAYVATAIGATGYNYDMITYITGPFKMAGKYQAEYQKFLQLRDKRAGMLKDIQLAESGNSGVYVLVIGESQSATHMSAYGYGRETTPWLSSVVADGEAILFKNAFSCHTHTVPVLTYALTEKNQYNQRELNESLSIVDMAKAAGFKTIWLSNQVHYGAWDTPTSVIADATDEQIFINTNIGETTDTRNFDMALVDRLKDIAVTERTLIIVHLMGCHGNYDERYPQDSAVFNQKTVVDAYDNAMLYNDAVVSAIYARSKEIPNFQGMIYFADHGDDSDANKGHNASNFTPAMAKVPVYMLFSADFQQKHPDKCHALQNASSKVITNDLMYNTVMSIMGIRHGTDYEPENDILSSAYNGDTQRFTTLYGEKSIADILAAD